MEERKCMLCDGPLTDVRAKIFCSNCIKSHTKKELAKLYAIYTPIYKQKHAKRYCQVCNKDITDTPFKRYCNECKKKYTRTEMLLLTNKNPNAVKTTNSIITRHCKNCGATFQTLCSRPKLYCSKECRDYVTSTNNNKKNTLCWTCKNTNAILCSWFGFPQKLPKGCVTASPTANDISVTIIKCPKYIKEEER